MVVQALQLKVGDQVVDIGSGSCYFSRRFAQVVGKNGSVYAVDIESGLLRHIQQKAKKDDLQNIVTVLAATNNPMLAPNSVDLIFICDTIHHISERKDYYKILLRDLKNQGRLVIVDFYKKQTAPAGPPVAMRIKKEHLIQELTSLGFYMQEQFKFLPRQYFLIFGKGQQQLTK